LPEKSELYINPEYWAEKCEAADRRTKGLDVYDADLFRKCVQQDFESYFEDCDDPEAKARCWQEIEETVLTAENEHEAFERTSQFECEGFEFSDFWEHNLRSWSYHFIWCCYAIAWGIRQYDAMHSEQHPEPAGVQA
jgi:hypothetical protein